MPTPTPNHPAPPDSSLSGGGLLIGGLGLVAGVALLSVGAVALFADLGTAPDAAPAALPVQPAPVAVRLWDVYDGDSLRVELPDGSLERVRLLGIDTPERNARARCPAEAAAAEAARAVLEGATRSAGGLRLLRAGTDRYGRTLGLVFADGRDMSALLLDGGHARAYQGGTRAGWCAE
jgi:micrococcal nuclease